ncbi:hypothetical protein RhiJN_01205 [Ceratobasidium sp. AG-Ba]|nr:hypothetical protein RhiJN_01205 [Ceratobasidium sp. AG-Ba]QRW02234.1 hypothetical protein RhiLY_01231 [Ceratobasidium sp. AG-Ba]
MNALRLAIRVPRPVIVARQSLLARSFSYTPIRRASEDSDSFMAGFRNSPIFNQLADKPEAIAALSKMAEYLKKQDIDLSTPPSSMTLFKLATNSEFRELTRQAMTEIRKAGIDLRPENAMELFAPKDPKGPK